LCIDRLLQFNKQYHVYLDNWPANHPVHFRLLKFKVRPGLTPTPPTKSPQR
jgi:hypothetical protein